MNLPPMIYALAQRAVDDPDAALVLEDALEELGWSDARVEWLLAGDRAQRYARGARGKAIVAVLIFGEWQTIPWRFSDIDSLFDAIDGFFYTRWRREPPIIFRVRRTSRNAIGIYRADSWTDSWFDRHQAAVAEEIALINRVLPSNVQTPADVAIELQRRLRLRFPETTIHVNPG